MSETIRVLVVSKNETLRRNMEEWFHAKVEAGIYLIDYAGSSEDAKELLSTVNYDKVFHNGIYVIPAIERLQVGADVYAFGKTNNNYVDYIENPHDKKKISKIFSKNYLKIGYNIGGLLGSAITIVVGLAMFIAFNVRAHTEIGNNTMSTMENKQEIREVKKEVDRVGDVAEENNTILKYVYSDEIKKALPKKKIIGDNDD